MNPYEVSVTMFNRQHDRWNHWALFFFGSIVSVFVLEEKVTVIPTWISLLLACFFSVMWVAVAISIRRTTKAWRKTILQFEKQSIIEDNGVRVFHIQEENWKETDPWEELVVALSFWKMETFGSVTKMLTLLGIFSAFFFFVLFLISTGKFGLALMNYIMDFFVTKLSQFFR